jgi:hypothetical protein
MHAEARKLVERDIVPEAAGLRDIGQQVPDQVHELLLRVDDMLTAVEESG